jgi:Na+/proline symporter
MMKISPRLSRLASPAMGYLVGVGAALSIAGALNGTILPQFFSGINMFDVDAARAQNMGFIEMITNGGIAIAGTITTLIYFQFGAKRTQDGSIKRAGLIEILAWVGGIFIAITLGVIFAGVLSTAMTALIERLNSVLTFIFSLIGPA